MTEPVRSQNGRGCGPFGSAQGRRDDKASWCDGAFPRSRLNGLCVLPARKELTALG